MRLTAEVRVVGAVEVDDREAAVVYWLLQRLDREATVEWLAHVDEMAGMAPGEARRVGLEFREKLARVVDARRRAFEAVGCPAP